MRPVRSTLLLACLAATQVGACSDCVREKCSYPTVLLTVEDALTAMALPGARAEGSGRAETCGPEMKCTLAVRTAGSGVLVVSADGYQSVMVPFEVQSDDCGNSVRQSRRVRLQPLTATAASEAGPPETGSAGCNGN